MSETDIFRNIADMVKTIAVVGLSPKPERPSWGVARFLQSQQFRIIPINPGHAGHEILNEKVFARLDDIPKDIKVDMLNIFRRSDAVPDIVDEAIAALPDLRVIWTQLGVRHDAAAEKARQAGLIVIQDRCSKIEFSRIM